MSTCVSSWIVAGVGELGGWRIGDAMRIAKAQDEVCGQLNSHGVFIVGCRKRGGVGGGTLGFIIVPLFFTHVQWQLPSNPSSTSSSPRRFSRPF